VLARASAFAKATADGALCEGLAPLARAGARFARGAKGSLTLARAAVSRIRRAEASASAD